MYEYLMRFNGKDDAEKALPGVNYGVVSNIVQHQNDSSIFDLTGFWVGVLSDKKNEAFYNLAVREMKGADVIRSKLPEGVVITASVIYRDSLDDEQNK